MTGDGAKRTNTGKPLGIAHYWNGEQIWIPATPLHFSTGTCPCLRPVRDNKGKAEYATGNHGGRLRLVEAVAGWSKIRRLRERRPRSTKCRPHLICARCEGEARPSLHAAKMTIFARSCSLSDVANGSRVAPAISVSASANYDPRD